MSKHTPGPWRADKRHTGPFDRITSDDGGVASPHFSGRSDEEINANARLIAAAPDLLEALEPFANADERRRGEIHPDAFTRARAAIAKARGAE